MYKIISETHICLYFLYILQYIYTVIYGRNVAMFMSLKVKILWDQRIVLNHIFCFNLQCKKDSKNYYVDSLLSTSLIIACSAFLPGITLVNIIP